MRSIRTLLATAVGCALLGTGIGVVPASGSDHLPPEARGSHDVSQVLGASQSQLLSPDQAANQVSDLAEDAQRSTGAGEPEPAQVQNPISDEFSDTYADPVVLRGKDGYWYLYATSDPLTEAPSEFGLMHIARSADFTEWEYLGEVFDEDTRPDWATDTSMFWAPDVRYVGGEYVMYYTVTDTVADPGEWNYAIGAATAPTPVGPWTDSGAAVVEPRSDGDGGYYNTIDPALFSDDDGTRYLYFGGYDGGIWVTELDESGLRAVGEPVQLTVPDRYEGAFVVKREGYYYLTASSANCCAGPSTGYSVYAGRSTSPTGPFVDHEGVAMDESRVGGTQVLVQNGNNIIGVGHHTIMADTTGQDWIVYHGLERDDPWLDEPGGVNERPAFIDRLDWIDGWPVTAAGAGPTEGALAGPTTGTSLDIVMDDPAASDSIRTISGSWTSVTEDLNDAGAVGLLAPDGPEPARVQTTRAAADEVRVEADVRFPDESGEFTVDLARIGPHGVQVTIDTGSGELRTEVSGPGGTHEEVATLPSTFHPEAFTAVVVEIRDGQVHAQLSESRLSDVIAEVRAPVSRTVIKKRPVALEATGGNVQVGNLSAAAVHEPVTDAVPDPVAGTQIWSEQFTGDLDQDWQWLRGDDEIAVEDGQLHWPLTATDIVGADNDGTALLRAAPAEEEWILQTEVNLDLGVDTNRNFQQAGLIVHVDDDDLVRLGTAAINSTRQVEFGKEQTADGRTDWGAHLGGPTAPTMWLRLHHSVDPDTGEQLYRSASSTDGQAWRWGATWTLPAGSEPQIGLYAGGGDSPVAEAVFEDVTLYEVIEEEEMTFTNPVYDQNFPDPFVLESAGTYYAYATNGVDGNMPVLTSTNLVDWEVAGDAMPQLAPWVESGRNWAPEVAQVAEDRFLAYYTARDPSADLQCVGVAEASDPLGPFVDADDEPLICQEDEGGSIDASPFTDVDGTSYLLWKNDGNHIGVRSWVYAQELSADGLSLVGTPQQLITHDQDWEGHLVEGASVWIHEGRYYMFYSANGYATPEYGVGYAVADDVLGPWTKPSQQPLMSSNDVAAGPGHGMVLEVGDRTWYVHHAWPPDSVGDEEVGRAMWLTPLVWQDGVPALHGPSQTVSPSPLDG
ncbi:MAG TPA: family 43 glycosylhydrolase [Beutenbergiaceae bacterium]|nr:family 43 glycosylhydrolase [Beutenbergiaceae bacterium]